MRKAGSLRVHRQLCADTPTRLVDGRLVIDRFVGLRHAGLRIRLTVTVVDVAAEIGRSQPAVIRVAAKQHGVTQEATSLCRDKREPILIDVGVRVRLFGIIEHRQR